MALYSSLHIVCPVFVRNVSATSLRPGEESLEKTRFGPILSREDRPESKDPIISRPETIEILLWYGRDATSSYADATILWY